MEVKIIHDKKEWNDFLVKHDGAFPQGWEWGEILLSEGKKVERTAVVTADGKMIAAANLVYDKRVNYVFSPKGPVFIKEASYAERESNLEFIKYLKEKGVMFFRLEPATLQSVAGHDSKKTIDINPRATTVLNLELSDEELLKRMHPKTRYNINLAVKKGVTIKEEKNFEVFMSLMKKTGSRDDFRLHDEEHYKQILGSGFARQLNAVLDGKTIACIILVGFGKTMTYLFGASDYEYRQFMAPHLLQWEGVKLAKSSGYKNYDFFGIAPQVEGTDEYVYDEKHQYAGVTRFKLGFGGEVVELPGTYDIIISNFKYKIYEGLRRLRRLI